MEAKSLRELFSKRGRWVKGHEAVNNDNYWVSVTDDNACRFCLWGGLRLVYTNNRSNIYSRRFKRASMSLEKAIERYTKGKFDSIIEFNDAPRTRLKDIRKVLDMAKV